MVGCDGRHSAVRDKAGLETALNTLESIQWLPLDDFRLEKFELRNMCEVALLMARCALWRKESRGAHFRTDFPEKRNEFLRASRISRAQVASQT